VEVCDDAHPGKGPANWLRGGDGGSRALSRNLARRREWHFVLAAWIGRQPRGSPHDAGLVIGATYYHTSVNASGAAAAAREFQVGRFSPNVNINLNVNLSGQADLMFIAPTYTFATPVFGGQLSATMAGVFGRNSASLAGMLTAAAGPLVVTRDGFLSDALTSYGDLYPTLKLKWNSGVNNFMVYAAGDIPVGDYDPNRLSNIGIGHGAIDLGVGYTYFDPATGNEFSGVGGFTYNFKNPDTQYQSGIDFHFDWGASHFLSKQVFVGLVGYAYQQITDDFGQPAAFARAFSASVRSLDIFSRLEATRHFSA